MAFLILWLAAGAVVALWRWTSLGRMRSSVDAHDRALRELDAIARRAPAVVRRRSDSMPPAHVRVLPTDTAVLRPPAKAAAKRRRPRRAASGAGGDRFGISA